MAKAFDEVGIVRVVEANEVEMLTRQGWWLQEILTGTHVQPYEESIPFVTHGSTYTTNAVAKKGLLVTQHKFVMVQGKKGTIQDLEFKLAEAQRYQYTAQTLQEKADRAAKEAVEALEKLKKEKEALDKHLNSSFTERHELELVKRKMENDIAKIRTAVGDLKMKEILGS